MLGKIAVIALPALLCAQEWPVYHGSYANTKHSPLKQIHTGNVSSLRLAWKFDAGGAGRDTEMQCNPLVRHGVMYVSSPRLHVFALDAATGAGSQHKAHQQTKVAAMPRIPMHANTSGSLFL